MNEVKNKSIKEQIREYVVNHIASGKWPLESRIPTRVVFEQLFNTTAVTVNSALRPLVTEGFLKAKGKSGTYVHPHPPPFDHYALIFPELFDERRQPPNFWNALQNAARKVEKQTGVKFKHYHDFSPHVDNPGYLQLADDLKRRRLAGILFGNWPYGMEKTALMSEISLPMFAIVSHFVSPKVRTIRFDAQTLFNEMAASLREQGANRPAVILSSSAYRNDEDFKAAFVSYDIPVPMEFVQFVHHESPWTAEHIVKLMFKLPEKARPDGILIGDDNLTDAVMDGLVAVLGEKEARKFPITMHVNFPLSGKALLPGIGVGFNLEEMLLSMIKEMSSPEQTVSANSYMIRPENRLL